MVNRSCYVQITKMMSEGVLHASNERLHITLPFLLPFSPKSIHSKCENHVIQSEGIMNAAPRLAATV